MLDLFLFGKASWFLLILVVQIELASEVCIFNKFVLWSLHIHIFLVAYICLKKNFFYILYLDMQMLWKKYEIVLSVDQCNSHSR